MPYRRLPNTDKARLRAMQTAIYTANEKKNVIPDNLIHKLKLNFEEFSFLLSNYNEIKSREKLFSKEYHKKLQNAKLYVQHFLLVLNLAVIRKDISKKQLTFYGQLLNQNLSELKNYPELSEYAQKLHKAETERTKTGHKIIQNPSMAEVLSVVLSVKDTYVSYLNLKIHLNNAHKKVILKRKDIDKVIREVWNCIENYYNKYPPLIKRSKAKKFGVVYFYRKNEQKIELSDILNI